MHSSMKSNKKIPHWPSPVKNSPEKFCSSAPSWTFLRRKKINYQKKTQSSAKKRPNSKKKSTTSKTLSSSSMKELSWCSRQRRKSSSDIKAVILSHFNPPIPASSTAPLPLILHSSHDCKAPKNKAEWSVNWEKSLNTVRWRSACWNEWKWTLTRKTMSS